MRRTHKQKNEIEKERRFYEKSTEENEIEKHSSYGLHTRIHAYTHAHEQT